MLKIALAQINPCVGDLKGNSDKIIAGISAAKKKGADLVIFGELALTGYPPQDLLLKRHFVDKNIDYLGKIKTAARGIAVLVGFVGHEKGKIHNSCALINEAKIIDVYHKVLLPNYGVFDEKRYFAPGSELGVYVFGNYRFGLTICEDIWNKNIASRLGSQNIDFIVNISASPFHLGKVTLRNKILSRAARASSAAVVYVNLVGGQDEIVFDGTSLVLSKTGEILSYAARFREDLTIFNLGKKKSLLPPKMITKEEEVYSALCLGLSDYVNKNGFRRVVVGVSGGIDSAVVLALACAALGKKRVSALIMPSRYTSCATLADAQALCRNLGVEYRIINIEEIFESYLNTFRPLFKGREADITEENVQARIRGNLLMAFSNKFGSLVLNTGNKSELSCGYCTLYGDMAGGFGVLKDVTKGIVYKLAGYINKKAGRQAIPASVIRRAPTAELRPNQKDSDTLPPYKDLDMIVKFYIEQGLSWRQIAERGYSAKLAKAVINKIDSNEYKRRQAPPGVKITPCAFGRDWRMPLTNKFK